MKLSDLFLTEASIPIRGDMVTINRNLSYSNLIPFLSNSVNKEISGLIVGNDILWWDSYYAIHSDIANIYDPDFHDFTKLFDYKKRRLGLKYINNKLTLFSGDDMGNLQHIPTLRRILSTSEFKKTMKGFS